MPIHSGPTKPHSISHRRQAISFKHTQEEESRLNSPNSTPWHEWPKRVAPPTRPLALIAPLSAPNPQPSTRNPNLFVLLLHVVTSETLWRVCMMQTILDDLRLGSGTIQLCPPTVSCHGSSRGLQSCCSVREIWDVWTGEV